MKKVALALLVLAITIPAMAEVQISLSNDGNEVTVSYNCSASEEVRAFALEITVSSGAYIVGSAQFAEDPNTGDYWVCPTNMTFTVSDGNTVVDEYGSPIVAETNDGCIIEVASLYAAGDPCHPSAPQSSGDLCSFFVNNMCDFTGDANVVVTVTQVNAQRGGVVLKNPDDPVTENLPVSIEIPCDEGLPKCWLCPGQPFGDTNGDGSVSASDYFNFRKAYGTSADTHPHGTGNGEYNCCCDFNQSGGVSAADYFIFRKYYGQTGLGSCSDTSCP